MFEGVVIKRQGHGARETFTVRKQSFGVGVERMFPLHSPKIEKIELAARGDVRRAKLYYLRDRVGKRARVRERRYMGPEETVQPGLLHEPTAEQEAPPEDLPDTQAAEDTQTQPADAPPEEQAAVAEEQTATDAEPSQPDGQEPAEAPQASAEDLAHFLPCGCAGRGACQIPHCLEGAGCYRHHGHRSNLAVPLLGRAKDRPLPIWKRTRPCGPMGRGAQSALPRQWRPGRRATRK